MMMSTEHHGETTRTQEPTQVSWPSWYTLFLGCFSCDAGSRRWSKRGFYGLAMMLLGLVGYGTLRVHVPETVLDFSAPILAGVGMGFIYWSLWRYMQDFDELHRQIMFHAIAFSFAMTMPIVVGLGIGAMVFNTSVDIIWAFVLAEPLRGVGLVLAARKYR
jgi:putative Mn2+ efflux pump MntP